MPGPSVFHHCSNFTRSSMHALESCGREQRQRELSAGGGRRQRHGVHAAAAAAAMVTVLAAAAKFQARSVQAAWQGQQCSAACLSQDVTAAICAGVWAGLAGHHGRPNECVALVQLHPVGTPDARVLGRAGGEAVLRSRGLQRHRVCADACVREGGIPSPACLPSTCHCCVDGQPSQDGWSHAHLERGVPVQRLRHAGAAGGSLVPGRLAEDSAAAAPSPSDPWLTVLQSSGVSRSRRASA